MCSQSPAVCRKLKIINEKGLHARASAKFVEVVEAHDAEARVSLGGWDVSGDSIMGLLTLGASTGSIIAVETRGPAAGSLADALEELVSDRFNEEY